MVVDAGRTSIQVIDDGKGMSETDARLAFERHATSKIKKADDLFALSTAENDYATQSMLKWFIDEQVEEEENAQNLIDNLRMLGDGSGYGLYMLDKELAARSYTQASPLAKA